MSKVDQFHLVPRAVRTVYQVWLRPDSSSPYKPTDQIFSQLITLAELFLAEFGSYTGFDGEVALDDSTPAKFTGTNPLPDNLATLIGVSTGTAKAWYLWQLGRQDLTFSGLVFWQPTGLDESVEWVFNDGECRTRVQQGPWRNTRLTFKAAPSVRADSLPACIPVTFNESNVVCEGGSLNVYNRPITLNVVDGCLTKAEGAWTRSHSAGLCGGVVVIYYEDITTFTTYVENVFYYNSFDERIYINIESVWIVYCPCVEGSYWWCMNPPPPVADFSGTPTSGEAPLSVAFTDSSTNTPTSWHWEKNDGSGWVDFAGSPTVQNPTELFAAGTWDIRLTATNGGGSDLETKTSYITAT